MAALGDGDGNAVLRLLDAQRVFRSGGVAKIAFKDLSAVKANAREFAGLVGVVASDVIDAFTVFRSLDPSFVAAVIASPEITEPGAPSACIVRRLSDDFAQADLVCLDLDGLGGVGPALAWLGAHITSDKPPLIIVAIGMLRTNLDEFEDRIDGVVSAPAERGLVNSWLRVLTDWWNARTQPELVDSKAALELGAVEADDVDAAIMNAALDDNDPRKQD